MRYTFISIGVLFIWISLRLPFNEGIVFKFSNAICPSYNKSWMTIHDCRLRAVSRNLNTFNFNGTVLHPAFDIRVKAQLFKKANGYKPWLYKVDIDVCQFVKKPFNPFVIIVFKLFKEFTNFNHTCPYNGTQMVDGFYLRWNHLPHAIPSGDYLLTIDWLFDKRPQFATNVYFIFTEDL